MVQIEVPEKLAERLEAQRTRLAEVLKALQELPFVHVSEEYAPETLSPPPLIKAKGKPVSEIVIEDRRLH